MVGTITFDKHVRLLRRRGLQPIIDYDAPPVRFRFGNGDVQHSIGVAYLPTGIHKRSVILK